MNAENKELFGEESNGLTIKDYLQKYLSYWPLFAVSLLVCVGCGIAYLKRTEPKYMTSTLILVKQNSPKSATDDLVENALSGSSQHPFDLDNQMHTITTTPVLERVVTRNTLNIFYYYVGKIRKTDIYLDAPFRLIPQGTNDNSTAFAGTLKGLTNEGGVIEYGNAKEPKEFNFAWNNAFRLNDKVFTLARKANYNYNKSEKYMVVWRPARDVAVDIAGNLMVSLLDKRTSILKLELPCTNISYGQDVLNAVYKEFNQGDIEERNIITQNSIRFIDDRLNLMSKELSGVEGNLESYQGRNQLINVETQSSQSFSNANNVSKDITNVNVQQGVINMIRNYFNSPSTEDKLVPSTLGIDDPTLTSLITKYNELQQRKQREAPLVAAGSTVLKDLNDQLTDIKGSILESLQNLNKNLSFQEKSLEQQNSQYKQFLSSLPGKERAMAEIKRKQGVTEGLYLYLLQKRETAAISSTSSSISNFKQIEPAKGYGPTEPIARNVYMYSILLGLFLPIGLVSLLDMLNDTVVTRHDISKKIQLPILADISHLSESQRKGIAIAGRDIVAEQFRILRTNLSILLKRDKAVILVTSSNGSEGKSLVSSNLAAVMSIPGKKVALLEFDLRKPGIASYLNIHHKLGLSDFLTGDTNKVEDIYTTLPDYPTLHVFPAGNVTSNPGDLLLNANLDKLFYELKNKYDYIVVDSAPTALVSDSFVLASYSDSVLYIVRQRKTLKKQLDFIQDLSISKRMKNISLVFNDIKIGGKFGYYGHGETYGKGYENGEETAKRKRKKEVIF